MDPSERQVSAKTPPMTLRVAGKAHSKQPVIKDEDEDSDDYLDGGSLDGDGGESSYRPRPQLPQPAVVMRSLAHLINWLEAGTIDVDPEYQREVVWTADRMTGLVNSLMENYYIPPIILNRKKQPTQDGAAPKFTLVCVDGKQRLSSVRAFVKGMIPCHDHRGEKWWYCEHPTGKARKVLSDVVQKTFLSKEFVSFEFSELNETQEEDLFARVQMGVQLTQAEKMRAQTGPWQELGKLFVDDFPLVFSLLKDRTRAKDFQLGLACFSQILEVQHPSNANGIPILKTNHLALPRLLENRSALDDQFKAHLAGVFNTFRILIEEDPDIFFNTERKLKGVQTFAPIELVAVAVIISEYSETRNNKLLLGDVQHLRNMLRENFIDLRMNATLWKFIWEYIENLEQIRGVVNGTTIDRATQSRPLVWRSPQSSTVKRGRPSMKSKPPASASAMFEDGRQSKRPRAEIHDRDDPDETRAVYSPDPTCSTYNTRLSPPSDSRASFNGVHIPSQTMIKQEALDLRTSEPLEQEVHESRVPSHPRSTRVANRQAKNALTLEDGAERAFPNPPNPSEASQNHVSQLNSYQAPTAPMSAVRSPEVAGHTKPYHRRASIPQSGSAAQLQSPMQTAGPSFAQYDFSSSSRRGSKHHLTSMNSNVDLTSDNEGDDEDLDQVRQNMLNSFRSKPANGASLSATRSLTEHHGTFTKPVSTNIALSAEESAQDLLIRKSPKKKGVPSKTNPYQRRL